MVSCSRPGPPDAGTAHLGYKALDHAVCNRTMTPLPMARTPPVRMAGRLEMLDEGFSLDMASGSAKRILADCGIAVSRVPPAARTRAARPRDTRGWLVEFVGPSGVGKTTLWRQVAPMLRRDWFFERHAKGLLGKITENETHATYLKHICARRLETLMGKDFPLERMASIGQRIFEVARLGLVSKSTDLPRGFIMDDGIAHFFAEQILEQDRDATRVFFERMAFIFIMPDEADARGASALWKRELLDVYSELRELVQELGRPTLVLERSNRADNPGQVISFIQQDVLRL